MCFDLHLTSRSDPTPFPLEARSAEKITVNGNPIVAAHVACGVNPPQMQMGWEDFELRTHFEHVVILPNFGTISGSTIRFHRDLRHKRYFILGAKELWLPDRPANSPLKTMGGNGCGNGSLQPLTIGMT